MLSHFTYALPLSRNSIFLSSLSYSVRKCGIVGGDGGGGGARIQDLIKTKT